MNADNSKERPGRLYGVGVGPGDPELLTLKAARILRESPVIITPQAEGTNESVAFNIVKDLVDPSRQQVVPASFPIAVGKPPDEAWSEAVEQIARYVRAGKDVAFLTQGDPMLYSSFTYVMVGIKSRYPEVPVEVVPAVSSINAAAASAQMPLVSHGERLAVLPAMYGLDNLRDALEQFDTVVLMKVNRTTLETVSKLNRDGRLRRGVLVTWATTPEEKVVYDLDQLSSQDPKYFSLLILSGRKG